MAFELDINKAGGVFSMQLTEVPASSVEAISEIFAQCARLVALYAEATILESRAEGLTPDTPIFRIVAQGFLRAQAHLHLASDASKTARDVLSGEVDVEDHPLLFDDE